MWLKQEMQVWPMDPEDPLEKEMATLFSFLAWEIPWTEEPSGLQTMKLQRVGHNWVTDFHCHSLILYTSSVQFSRSVVSDSWQPHESQHAKPPCPSPTPVVYSTSCPLSRWCHPAILSSVVPFSSCPQSLPASEFFQWVNSSHEVVKVLEFQLQHQSLQWTPRTDLL